MPELPSYAAHTQQTRTVGNVPQVQPTLLSGAAIANIDTGGGQLRARAFLPAVVDAPLDRVGNAVTPEALATVGDAISKAAMIYQDEVDTLQAQRAILQFNDEMARLEGSYKGLSGMDALDAHDAIRQDAEAKFEAALERLDPNQRKKFMSMGGFSLYTSTRNAIAGHAVQQKDVAAEQTYRVIERSLLDGIPLGHDPFQPDEISGIPPIVQYISQIPPDRQVEVQDRVMEDSLAVIASTFGEKAAIDKITLLQKAGLGDPSKLEDWKNSYISRYNASLTERTSDARARADQITSNAQARLSNYLGSALLSGDPGRVQAVFDLYATTTRDNTEQLVSYAKATMTTAIAGAFAALPPESNTQMVELRRVLMESSAGLPPEMRSQAMIDIAKGVESYRDSDKKYFDSIVLGDTKRTRAADQVATAAYQSALLKVAGRDLSSSDKNTLINNYEWLHPGATGKAYAEHLRAIANKVGRGDPADEARLMRRPLYFINNPEGQKELANMNVSREMMEKALTAAATDEKRQSGEYRAKVHTMIESFYDVVPTGRWTLSSKEADYHAQISDAQMFASSVFDRLLEEGLSPAEAATKTIQEVLSDVNPYAKSMPGLHTGEDRKGKTSADNKDIFDAARKMPILHSTTRENDLLAHMERLVDQEAKRVQKKQVQQKAVVPYDIEIKRFFDKQWDVLTAAQKRFAEEGSIEGLEFISREKMALFTQYRFLQLNPLVNPEGVAYFIPPTAGTPDADTVGVQKSTPQGIRSSNAFAEELGTKEGDHAADLIRNMVEKVPPEVIDTGKVDIHGRPVMGITFPGVGSLQAFLEAFGFEQPNADEERKRFGVEKSSPEPKSKSKPSPSSGKPPL